MVNNITVYVVYDPLLEHICSVHRQEDRAIHRAVTLDDEKDRKIQYRHDIEEFELED